MGFVCRAFAESARIPSCAVLVVNQFLLNFPSLEPLEPQPHKSSTTSNTSVDLIKSILSIQASALDVLILPSQSVPWPLLCIFHRTVSHPHHKGLVWQRA
jgi:hypothetical protein